jgi:hypothetical protein
MSAARWQHDNVGGGSPCKQRSVCCSMHPAASAHSTAACCAVLAAGVYMLVLCGLAVRLDSAGITLKLW